MSIKVPVRHTPGPWFPAWNFENNSRGVRGGYASVYNSPDLQGRQIASVVTWTGTEEQNIANAVLMSASPQLLAFAAMALRAARMRQLLVDGEIEAGLAAVEKALHYETVEQYLYEGSRR